MFLQDFNILKKLEVLKGHTGTIIHGRYDMICPIKTAIELKQNWPRCKLKIIPKAGHSAVEPGIQSALLETMEDLKHR